MDYVYILGTILFTVYGQMVVKWQVNLAGPMPTEIAERSVFMLKLLFNPWILSSLTGAFLAFLCWVGAMTKFELSYAYPFTSLSFVLVLVMSTLFFRESVSISKVLGIAFILAGIFLGSRG